MVIKNITILQQNIQSLFKHKEELFYELSRNNYQIAILSEILINKNLNKNYLIPGFYLNKNYLIPELF